MRRLSIVVVALVCAGCAPATPAPAGGSRHNQADADFVAALIPHHRAGIALAQRVANSPEHRVLAEAIVSTERDEITRMSGWLTSWGVPAPASSGSSSPAGPPSPSGPAAASGPRASSASASPAGDPAAALAAHQEEAITLAQREQAQGSNPDALAFARQIVESRTAEAAALR